MATDTAPPTHATRPLRLAGAHVVVYGGSTGIGYALAELAKAEGATLTLTGRDPAKLEAAACELGGARTVPADVADRAAMARSLEGVEHVDHVFVSAGSVTLGGVLGGDLGVFERGVSERLWGNLNALRAAAPKLRAGGSVTLMSGVRADRPAPGSAMTTALVAAVEALTRALSVELAPLRVNAISPGWTDTPLVRGLLGNDFAAFAQREGARVPLGRFGHAREVAEAVLFLMTSGYVTGEVLHIDGGLRWV
jgi:NAD(P)-dependent dehydrogenase (short-subunit alcohol dehydrogenase family)